jgi:hypothetical protein
MGLLTPKNNKNDKKGGNKAKSSAQPSSQFFKSSNSKPVGANKKPIKTGGSRGS